MAVLSQPGIRQIPAGFCLVPGWGRVPGAAKAWTRHLRTEPKVPCTSTSIRSPAGASRLSENKNVFADGKMC